MTPGVAVAEPAGHRRIRLTVGMVAVTTALFAAGQTITYLALVRSSASPENLAQAERRLLRPGRHADWEWLGQAGQAAVAVEIGGGELADLLVERENLGAGETEKRAFVFRGGEGVGLQRERGEEPGEGGAEGAVWQVVAGFEKRAETASGWQGWRAYSPMRWRAGRSSVFCNDAARFWPSRRDD